MIGPLIRFTGTAISALNTAATAYLVGQIGWIGYKKWRQLQNEKMTASEVRESFIKVYKESNGGEEPPDQLIKTVLDAHNATEFPIRKRIGDAIERCRQFVVRMPNDFEEEPLTEDERWEAAKAKAKRILPEGTHQSAIYQKAGDFMVWDDTNLVE